MLMETAVPFPWRQRQYKMAASTQGQTNSSNVESSSVRLPSLPTTSSSPSKPLAKPLAGDIRLPLLPTATKGEKYTQLRQFDRQGLKRHKAHFRNALKTTEGIEKITKQLNKVYCIVLTILPSEFNSLYNTLHACMYMHRGYRKLVMMGKCHLRD